MGVISQPLGRRLTGNGLALLLERTCFRPPVIKPQVGNIASCAFHACEAYQAGSKLLAKRTNLALFLVCPSSTQNQSKRPLELNLHTTDLLVGAVEIPTTGARYWVFNLREADLSGCGGPMVKLTS
jgi:hypothetical protein